MTALTIRRTHVPFWPTVGLAVVAWLIAAQVRVYGNGRPLDPQATSSHKLRPMSPSDVVVLLALLVGAVALVGANIALQRLARPDRGSERIVGCCGMALPSAITDPQADDR